jgi:hypothetical protein
MPFLITGNAKSVYLAFGYENLVAGTEDFGVQERDISRTRFFGLALDCERHRRIWLNPQQTPATHYSYGNMDAGNLVFLFSSSSLQKRNEDNKEQLEIKKTSFAFVDQNGILSGLQICFRKDKPDQWLIGLIKNTNLLPIQRQVFIMTSFEPTVLCQSTCNITEVTSTDNPLIQALASPMLAKFIGQILLANGTLHPASNVIELFLQLVLPQTEFLANDELLQAFNEKMPAILTNEVLKLLQQYRLFPSPQQVLRCLDPESEFYRLLSAFEPGENKQEDHCQLAMLLRLDTLGLDISKQTIDDINRFLSDFFSDKHNIKKALGFILESDCYTKIFFKLQELASLDFWQVVEQSLDSFQAKAISRVLINRPKVSQSWLMSFRNALNTYPSLKQVFDPLALADFLIADSDEDWDARLKEICIDHSLILAKYENAARACNQPLPLSSKILKTLGKYYLQGQAHLLKLLDRCDSPKQIDAGCILLRLGFAKEEVSEYIQNSSLVSAINWLKKNGLAQEITNILTSKVDFLTLIESLNSSSEKKAVLILFVQGQLNAREIPKLKADFAQFPKLANLIVSLYGKRILGQQLKQIAFNPLQHQVAYLLLMLNLDFSIDQLTPVACQLILSIADLFDQFQLLEGKANVNNYLRAVLPLVLQYINQGCELTVCLQYIDSQSKLFVDNGSQETVPFVIQLRNLLVRQLNVLSIGRGAGVAEDQQLMNTRLIAEELARGIAILENTVANQKVKAALHKQLFAGFAALDENCQLTEKMTIKVIKILINCHLQAPEAPLVPVDLLLKKPLWADAIHQLSKLASPHLDNIIRFISQNEEKGTQYCQAVLKVRRECKVIRERLKAEDKEKYNRFIEPEKDYRRSIYQAIYEEFDPKSFVGQSQKKTLGEKIKAAEAQITNIVEIDRHPWLRRAMMVIYNLLTILFTVGRLNTEHQRKTGDWYFFARPASSEAVRRLDLEILDEVKTAMMA